MSEYQEDIMKAARVAMETVTDDGAAGVIARAILVERERCANIAKPAKRPCDCERCDCRNQTASEAVVAWEVQNIIHQSIMKGGAA